MQSFITLYPSNIVLYVLGPPSAPSNPAYQEIDPCSMRITWLPPFTLDGVPLYFNITVTNASTQETIDYASTEDAQYVISPIDLTGTYTVCIMAWNAAGSSDEVSLVVPFAVEGVCTGTCECMINDGDTRMMVTSFKNMHGYGNTFPQINAAKKCRNI